MTKIDNAKTAAPSDRPAASTLLRRFAKVGASIAALLACTACAGLDLEGDWESTDTVGGERNELAVDDNGRGEAVLFFYFDGDLYKGEFDVKWEEKDNGDIEFELDCDGPSELDFTMDCEVNDDEDELECTGDGGWRDYEFEWERRN